MSTELTEASAEIGTPTNPFPGLRPFALEESHLFFGRDGQSEQLISKLGGTRFLAVVGTSGSGKSSLVRAGLLPTLLGGFMTSAGSDWRIAIVRPGNDPIGNLAKALNGTDVFGSEIEENAAVQIAIAEATLRRGSLGLVDAVRQASMPENENLLVVVDQFEEIFRFARVSEGETYHNDAAAFVKLILEASGQREVPIFVVLTMRSDYLGDCSQFWDLPEAINESQYLIPRLTRDHLREAIIGPAAVGLGKITPRLVNRLLNDVGDDQDQLPILQHALMRSWDEWKLGSHDHQTQEEVDALDLCCYQFIGGMAEALSRHADEAFNELPDDRSREVAEKLFKCLTEKGADNREIRRPIMLGEISAVADATEAEVISVIETFRQPGRSFLMPPADVRLRSESLIDVSHESLIRCWTRLKNWVEEEARSARIYRRLAETAELHRENRAGLWGDPDLQLALDWQEKNKPNEEWAGRYYSGFETAIAFLQASAHKRTDDLARLERQRTEAEERAQKELVQAKALAEAQQQRAEAERQKAEQHQQRLEEQAKSASRLRRLNKLLIAIVFFALASAVIAMFFYRTAEAAKLEAQEQRDLAKQQEINAIKQGEIALAEAANAKKEKERAEGLSKSLEETNGSLTASNESLKDAKAHLEQQIAIAEEARLTAEEQRRISFGRQLAAQSENARGSSADSLQLSALLAIESLKQPTLEGDQSLVKDLALLPRRVASWKSETGNQGFISPNGGYLAAIMDNRSVEIWDTATRKSIKLSIKIEGKAPFLVFNQDGRFLATVGGNTAQVWDAASGKPLGPPITRKEPFESVALSHDGRRLAVETCLSAPEGRFSDDCGAQILDVATGVVVGTPMLQNKTFKTNRIEHMVFSKGGELLATAGNPVNYRADDSLVYIWDVAGNKLIGEPLNLGRSTARALQVIFSPDKRYLVTAGRNRIYRIWSVTSHQEIGRIAINDNTGAMAFSEDGKHLALREGGDAVRVFSLAQKEQDLEVAEVARLSLSVDAFAFNSEGQLVTARDDGSVESWNIVDNDAVANVSQSEATAWIKPTFEFSREPGAEATSEAIHATSPDGRIVARVDTGGTIHINLARTAEEVCRIKPQGKLEKAVFSPNGKRLVTFSVISVGDSEHEAKWLIQIWDAAVGNTIGQPGKAPGRTLLTGFSPDGKWLAVAVTSPQQDRAVSLWDVNTGRQIWKEVYFNAQVNGLAFSPDGKYLATLNSRPTDWFPSSTKDLKDQIQVFEIASQQKVAERNAVLGHVAFSPDGKYLVNVSGEDTRAWLWRPEDLIGEACSRLSRGFTDLELREFFGTDTYAPKCKIPDDSQGVRNPR